MEGKTKEKWKKGMESEFISSEESANDEEGDYIIIVKPLLWRTDKVS